MKKNHLANAASPYLQQHALNPVNWYPWSSEALAKARKEQKPILLSIGYAACHWCHVMAHESFEDEETAVLMNKLFINIKVDREERPDLDKIYQTAHQLLNRHAGGWPLTVFLTPDDLTPFFSGTYFPRESRHQLPAFKDVLKAIADAYYSQTKEIHLQNQELRCILQRQAQLVDAAINIQPLHLAEKSLTQRYDSVHGGFGTAPKFPQCTLLEFLFYTQPKIVKHTLEAMAKGGLYDQLSGGFYRYTVDAAWQIPHFEKMLYENAQLLYLYTLAAQQYDESFFADIARETANWVLANMQSIEGGYYSSLDADSEGEEGKFYVWDKAEIESLLTPTEFQLAKTSFGLNLPPNFENHWHLILTQPGNLTVIKQKLLAARLQRITPARDEKILTAWNALMIKSMLLTGDKLQESHFIDSANQALTYIQQNFWNDSQLYATQNIPAYLDDIVYLIDALLAALQVDWNTEHLQFAIILTEFLLTHFYDEIQGGFFFTAHSHETLLFRPKTYMDEAMPAGNGIAVQVLLTLGYLLGETRYIDAAEKTLKAAWASIVAYPAEHCALLIGLKNFLTPPSIIIIRGNNVEMQRWRNHCKLNLANLVFAIPHTVQDLPGFLSAHKSEVETTAYICQGMQCLTKISIFEDL